MAPWVAVVLLILIGCVPQREISPASLPDAVSQAKFPVSIAVVCSEKTTALVERFSLQTTGGGKTAYYFQVGEPLCQSLMRSVEATYARAALLPAQPPPGTYGRVFEFTVQSSHVFVPPGVQSVNAGALRYTLFVLLNVYDGGTMAAVKGETVQGVGYPPGDRLWSWLREPAAEAIEAAIQDLAVNTAALLSSGFAEPR